jgi:hypothetical protein
MNHEPIRIPVGRHILESKDRYGGAEVRVLRREVMHELDGMAAPNSEHHFEMDRPV